MTAPEFMQGMGISTAGRWHRVPDSWRADPLTESAPTLCGSWCYVSTNVAAYTPHLRPVVSGDRWAPKCATCDRIHDTMEGK